MSMRGKVLGAGAFVLLATSLSAAQAQGVPPGCTAQGNPGGAVTGALLGGVAGALLGNAVSGHHKAGGTIVGGVTGAAAGAMIGGSQPCPQGYVYQGPPPGAQPLAEPVVARDDFWYGAPPSIRERIGFLRHRIDRLDSEGWLAPRESEGLRHRLGDVARRDEDLHARFGPELPPDARAHLNDELNEVARRLRWKEYQTQHAGQ